MGTPNPPRMLRFLQLGRWGFLDPSIVKGLFIVLTGSEQPTGRGVPKLLCRKALSLERGKQAQ